MIKLFFHLLILLFLTNCSVDVKSGIFMNKEKNKSAKKILLQDGSHREWGARPLRRIIQNKIENEISIK